MRAGAGEADVEKRIQVRGDWTAFSGILQVVRVLAGPRAPAGSSSVIASRTMASRLPKGRGSGASSVVARSSPVNSAGKRRSATRSGIVVRSCGRNFDAFVRPIGSHVDFRASEMTDPQFIVLVGPGIDQRSIAGVLSGLDVRIESSWSAVRGRVGHATVLAIIAPRVTPTLMGNIRAVWREHTSLPILLMTEFSRAIVRRINRLPVVDDIIPLEELADLAAMLKTAASRSLLAEAAAWIESCDHIQPDLRAPLVH
jgi:hypothetical protein